MTTSYYSVILDYDAGCVWEVIRDFNGLATWFSGAVSSSEIEDGRTASDITALLMGSDVPPRKDFIYEHAQDAALDI